eukprot:UN03618
MGKTPFIVVDVGGQKSERKKWIHCFDRVDAVVFVVSLSCYDEVLFEDENVNAMEDNLSLFEDICKLKALNQSPIVLLLNKKDVFAEKIKTVPLQKCPSFMDYNGRNDSFDETTNYIQNVFMSLHKTSNDRIRNIYTHIICAIDTETIRRIFKEILEIIIERDEIRVTRELMDTQI